MKVRGIQNREPALPLKVHVRMIVPTPPRPYTPIPTHILISERSRQNKSPRNRVNTVLDSYLDVECLILPTITPVR